MHAEFYAPMHPLTSLCAIIPAREPEPVLPEIVRALLRAGFGRVMVVDDGSSAGARIIFSEVEAAGAEVLRHAVNLGKGRALKSAFNAVLAGHPEIAGVITADADGQHTVEDIIHVGRELSRSNEPVIGSRSFTGEVPLRSRFGNTLTRYVFTIATGAKVGDTQSGLRGLPRSVLLELMTLDGERYEYEMNMLAHLCLVDRQPIEAAIATVYLEENRSSHFNPVRDSMRIYFVLARFVMSSILAAGLDLLLFSTAFMVTGDIAAAVVFGRVSSLVNFTVNRRYVFRNRAPLWRPLTAYYLLASAVALASYGSITILSRRGGWNVIAGKLLVDSVLSVVSFWMQRVFIFRGSRKAR